MSKSADLHRKVQGLLDKASRTDNEHEADAFYEAAQRLMIKYAIDEADLAPEQRERIETKRIVVGASPTDHQLLWDIAGGYGQGGLVKAVRHKSYPADSTAFTLVGFPADIDFVLLLHASLMLQRETLLRQAQRPEWESARVFNRSFRMGFSFQIRSRLAAAHRKASEQVTASRGSPGTAIVLVERHEQVERAFAEAFPNLATARLSAGRSGAGFSDGGAAANRADISGGRRHVGNPRGELTA